NEGVERLCHPPVTVHEVQNFVAEDEHPTASRLEEPRQRVGPWRCRLRRSSERSDAVVAGELMPEIQPGRVQAIVRIPGVADEDGDPAVRDLPDAGVAKQALYSVELTGSLSALDQMVE